MEKFYQTNMRFLDTSNSRTIFDAEILRLPTLGNGEEVFKIDFVISKLSSQVAACPPRQIL